MLKLGSLFDGVGGWPMAAVHSGAVVPVWASEVDEFPSAVTEVHFPEMAQLGDICAIDGAEVEPVDIITMGSPCQDLSIAGRRAGLDGERSGLFMEGMRIVNEMRDATGGRYPRFVVWENVPGAFSSNKGLDFKAVLEAIGAAELPMPDGGKWAYAGMVQYWGVPQRRKRIFLVADFGTSRRCAGEILFECESVRGDSAENEGAREGAANGTAVGVGTPDGDGSLTPYMQQGSRVQSSDGTSATLSANSAGGTKSEPVLWNAAPPVVLKIRQPKKKGGGSGAMYKEDQAYTLVAHQDMTIFERGFND